MAAERVSANCLAKKNRQHRFPIVNLRVNFTCGIDVYYFVTLFSLDLFRNGWSAFLRELMTFKILTSIYR